MANRTTSDNNNHDMTVKFRVIVFMSNHEGELSVESKEHKNHIEENISDQFELIVCYDKNKLHLKDALYNHKPDIVIFFSHGDINQIELGQEKMAYDKLLIAFKMKYFLWGPKLIILASCKSDVMAKQLFIETHIPTIGCNANISGEALRKFIVKLLDQFNERDVPLKTAFDNATGFIGMLHNASESEEYRKIQLHYDINKEREFFTCSAEVPDLPPDQIKKITQFPPNESSLNSFINKQDKRIVNSCQASALSGLNELRWYLRWTRKIPQNHIVLAYFNGAIMVERDYCLDEKKCWRLCPECKELQLDSPVRVRDFYNFITLELEKLNGKIVGYSLREDNMMLPKYSDRPKYHL